MHKTRVKALRDHLQSIPDREFDYSSFLLPSDLASAEYDVDATISVWSEFWRDSGAGEYPCGTTGCVAGHCCVLNNIPVQRNESAADKAKNFLDLSGPEVTFLFYDYNEFAKRSDAIARLNHLLDGGNVYNYDFGVESWWPRRKELV